MIDLFYWLVCSLGVIVFDVWFLRPASRWHRLIGIVASADRLIGNRASALFGYVVVCVVICLFMSMFGYIVFFCCVCACVMFGCFVCLFVCLFVWLVVCLFVCLCVCLFVCLFCLFV
jgi:hypothetical protein